MSGHGNNLTERRSLTSWGRHRERLVRTRKRNDRATHTYFLEMASEGTGQDTKRNRLSDAYSQAGDGIGRDLSGHDNKPTEQRSLTFWRRHWEGLVRTRNETDRAMRTHFLETASGGTRQDTETNRPIDAHSPSGDGIGRDLLEH